MRILYVVEASFAGVGRHVLDVAAGMIRRGHDVHVAYSPRRADNPFLAELGACSAARAVPVPMRRAPHPSDLSATARVVRHVQQHGPFDVIHGVSSKGGALARLVGLLTRTPVCYSPQAFVTMSPQLRPAARRIYGSIERGLARMTSRVIAASEVESRHAAVLGVPASKLAVVPNAVAPFAAADRAALRAAFDLAPSTVAIGFVGRLEEQKAPDLLVEAVAKMPEGLPGHRFLFLGSGSHEQRLKAMSERLGVADRIAWLGNQPRETIIALDLLVLPSDYEGFPHVLLEALQVGLPIVVTPVGGAREAVRHMENGIVVPHRDAETLARSIAFLISDPERMASMAHASRSRASAFTLDTMLVSLEATYRQCLEEAGRQPSLQPVAG